MTSLAAQRATLDLTISFVTSSTTTRPVSSAAINAIAPLSDKTFSFVISNDMHSVARRSADGPIETSMVPQRTGTMQMVLPLLTKDPQVPPPTSDTGLGQHPRRVVGLPPNRTTMTTRQGMTLKTMKEVKVQSSTTSTSGSPDQTLEPTSSRENHRRLSRNLHPLPIHSRSLLLGPLSHLVHSTLRAHMCSQTSQHLMERHRRGLRIPPCRLPLRVQLTTMVQPLRATVQLKQARSTMLDPLQPKWGQTTPLIRTQPPILPRRIAMTRFGQTIQRMATFDQIISSATNHQRRHSLTNHSAGSQHRAILCRTIKLQVATLRNLRHPTCLPGMRQ